MHNYNHKEIEEKWQKKWAEAKIFEIKDSVSGKKNKYLLAEFPYPSGDLHVGHWYAFAIPDIYVRFQKLLGYNVLYPIGFDAFGLPAENAAIKRGLNPRDWTFSNMETMKKQLESMGASFDWSREIITCNSDYYKWTQWLFIQFFKKGLVYQKESFVNWCPSCKTVLANEQVLAGKCERCETEVVQKNLKQWFIKITDYADKLIDDLENLDWPNHIKESQKNWIGRSQGALIPFSIKDHNIYFEVFTTRPDTLFGASYVVFAPEHELVQKLLPSIQNKEEVFDYIEKTKRKTEMDRVANSKEKTGVKLNGIFAINPANNEEIPIFIADYVLAGYGTGSIMAVPAHDERDFEFATKFNLPIKKVVGPLLKENNEEIYTGEGVLINSENFDGLSSEEAKEKITDYVGGKISKNYRLRDWLISRQRYWGTPIPIIHCEKCGALPESAVNLPIELPEITDYLPRDDGQSPLSKAEEWVNVKCPKCKGDAKRETDTLDTFIDSSWYFLRYTDPQNANFFTDEETLSKWMPVDFYFGGSEHTTMHLLFARFFQKVLFDLNLVKENEPFQKRLNRGLILGTDGNKMSKSKGNVVNPDEHVEKLGADSVRMYLAFIGPYNEPGSYPWDINGLVGMRRFLEKVVKLSERVIADNNSESEIEVKKALNKMLKKVSADIEVLKLNTAISSMMIFVNSVEKLKINKQDFKTFLIILSCFAPHLAEELNEKIGNKDFVTEATWPELEDKFLEESEIKLAVQINGKTRAIVSLPKDIEEDQLQYTILDLPEIKKWIGDKPIIKFIYVKGKIVSIVI